MSTEVEIRRVRRLVDDLNEEISYLLTVPPSSRQRSELARAETRRVAFQRELDALLGRKPAPTPPPRPARATRKGRRDEQPDEPEPTYWRPPSCDVTRLPTSKGGWTDFEFSPEEAEELEYRDRRAIAAMQKRIADYHAGKQYPCPPAWIHGTFDDGSIHIQAHALVNGKKEYVGGLVARPSRVGGKNVYVSGASNVEHYDVLADCPGIGRRMYERAAEMACEKKSVLVGSRMRSVFSEKFWQRQITKGRATCTPGGSSIHEEPHKRLRQQLLDGRVTVPQFVALTCNVMEEPAGDWKCGHIPLFESVCPDPPDPKKKIDLSGLRLRGRGRYRLTTTSRRR